MPATVTAPATAPAIAGVSLPPIIAGPILRRVTPDRLVLWLVLSAPLDLRLSLYRAGASAPLLTEDFACAAATQVRIGRHAFVRLIDLQPAGPLPVDECDDVAGPMLAAIHQVVDRLGLYPERLTGATVPYSAGLMVADAGYYRRSELLRHTRANRALQDLFFGGASKPIFTTASAHNHLITLAEVAAMYLLIWSPALWPLIRLDPGRPPRSLAPELAARYAAEYRHRRLYNGSALGRVRLDADGTPVDIRLLMAEGGEVVFPVPP